MAIRLRLGDEFFDIPTVGDSNWGEQVTLYLRKNSEIIATIQGPQDILLTEKPLSNGVNGQSINGLKFDVSNIQQIEVDGIITRKYNTAQTPKIDSFTCEGIFDGTDFVISNEYIGTRAGVTLDIDNSGQFICDVDYVDGTSVSIKFRAKAIIDVE